MRKPSQLLILLFFISGACGLIYEVAWTRLFVVVIGNTVFSVSAILTVFMAGLALGSRLSGRLLDTKSIRLVRSYALLECGIGVYNLLLPVLLKAANPIFGALYRAESGSFLMLSLGRFAIALVLLIVPATFMGATLPILIRFYVDKISTVGTEAGRVYTANTLGAAFGAAAAGFIIIPDAGVNAALIIAAALNLAIAAGAWQFSTSNETLSVKKASSRKGETSVLPGPPIILVAMLGSGFAALMDEVGWTRVLGLVVGPTTYAFTLMLVSMIAGLGIGAAIGSRIAAKRTISLGAFAWIEIAVGLASLAIIPLFGRLPIWIGEIVVRYLQNFNAIQETEFAIFFGIMLVPTTLLGMTFPIASGLYARSNSLLGSEVSAIYAFNTVGGIIGSLVAGFFLIPYIGSQWTLIVAACINAAIGILLAPPPRHWAPFAVAMLLVPAIILIPHWNPQLMTSGAYKIATYYSQNEDFESIATSGELLYFKEGATTTVTVRKYRGDLALAVDGKVDATDSGDMATQKLLADVPLLLNANAKNVAIVGLGSGVTAGAALQYPIQSLDVVEISPEVAEASDFFKKVNHDALRDPRTHLIIGDGRNHLRYTSKQYDVIISEPSNPWISGMASLFTLEFFNEARSRLTPTGIHCQWFHSYNMDASDLRMIIGTFRAAFPHAQFWAINKDDFMLLGSPSPIQIPDSIAENFKRIAPDLQRVRIYDLYSVLSLYMLEDGDLDTYAAGTQMNTDSLPLLEFHAPRYLYANTTYDNFQALLAVRKQVPTPPLIARTIAAATWENHRNKAEMDIASYQFEDAIPELRKALAANIDDARSWNDLLECSRAPQSRPTFENIVQGALAANPRPIVRISAAEFYSQVGDYKKAGDLLIDGLKNDTKNFALLEKLVEVWTLEGNAELAPAVESLLAHDPGNVTGLYGLASERFNEKRYDEAIQILKGILDKHSAIANVRNLLAVAYWQTSQGSLAEAEFQKYVADFPKDSRALDNYGLYLLDRKRPLDAIGTFRKAITIDPGDVQAFVGLGDAYRGSGKNSEARKWYQIALKLDPNQPVARQYGQ